MGVPVVKGGDKLPCPIGMGLTARPIVGGGGSSGPLGPPDSGITAFSLHSALYSALYFVYRQCIDNVGAGGARAPPEFGGSERGEA